MSKPWNLDHQTDREWEDGDVPELGPEFFTNAEPPVRKRGGRPAGSGTKTQVTLSLDADLVAYWRATGPGWQTRLNAILVKATAAARRRTG